MELMANQEMTEDSFNSCHENQKIFLQQPLSPFDKKFAKLNMLEDVSCWSGSLRNTKIDIDINDIQLQSQAKESNLTGIEDSDKGDNNSVPSSQVTKQFNQRKSIQSPSPFKKRMQKFFNFPNDFQNINPDFVQSFESSAAQSKRRTIISTRQVNALTVIQNRSCVKTQNLASLYFYGMLKVKMRLLKFYKSFTFSGRTSLLNAQIRERIHDISDYYTLSSKQNSCFSLLVSQLIERLKKWIECLNFPKISISVKFILLCLFTFINYWLIYAYSCILIFQAEGEWITPLLLFYQLIWIIEIFIRICVGSFSLTQSTSSQATYHFQYVKQRLLFDLTPLAILLFWSYLEDFTIIKTAVFLKIINVSQDFIKIQKHLCHLIKKYYLVQIINLIQKLFLIGHSIACLWYLIGQMEKKYFGVNETWVDTFKDEDQIWWKIYIWSIYWALTLMTTGSNVAGTVTQACFASIIMLFITISFGYILNVIGYILQEMDETGLQRRKDISVLNEYMRQRSISKTLKAQVNKNLDHYYKQNLSIKQENNQQVLQKISYDLQNQILQEYNKQIFSKINCLINNFSTDSLKELSLLVKEEHYTPDSLIFKGEDSQESSMMFIISGSVELRHKFHTSKDDKLTLKRLQKCDIFGQVQFFTGISEQYIVQSKEFTTLLKIRRQDFIDIIRKYENDYEVFSQIKDNLLLYKESKEIYLFCEVCKTFCHSMLECHLAHFDKERASYLIGARQSLKQSRKVTTRVNKFKQKTLKIYKYLLYSIQKYREDKLLNTFSICQNNEIDYASNNSSLSSSLISEKDEEEEEEESDQIEEAHSPLPKSRLESIKFLSDNPNIHHKSIDECASMKSQVQESISLNSPEQFYFLNQSQRILESHAEEFIKEAQRIILENAHQQNGDNSIINQSVDQKEFIKNSKKNSIEKERATAKDLIDSNPWTTLKVSNQKVSLKQPSSLNTFLQASQYDEGEELKSKSSKSENKKRKRGFRMADSNKQQRLSNEKAESSFNLIQLLKLQNYIKKYNPTTSGILDNENPWDFEILKEYKYYFPQGNSKQQIQKFSRYFKRKIKEAFKKKIKKL